MAEDLWRRLSRRSAAGLTLAALVLAASASAQTTSPASELPRGRVVEDVVCRADPDQRYALYLPASYAPSRRWPILYCFDPVARGALPVERFAEAAERYGWIVVGSHNSRNGPTNVSLAAAAAVWADTHARFALDDRRVYTTGFSGGARVATLTAYGCTGCIAGVIACGAGFPTSYDPLEGKLENPIRFAWFGAVGVDDFNFPEIVRLDTALDRLGVVHAVRRFDGGHDWAPPALCVTAVEWMEVEAMRSGARERDVALAESILARWLADAGALEAAGRAYDALLAYEDLADRFKGVAETAAAEARIAALRADKAVKAAREADESQIKRQLALAKEIASLAVARADQDQRLVAAQEFRRRIEELRKAGRAERDSSERRVARRTLHQIFAYFYETGLMLGSTGKDAEAAASLEIAADVAPPWPGVFYELAAARARSGDRKKAIAALQKAIERGFDDAERMRTDAALASLRDAPEFARLLELASRNRERR